jgi:4-hydroxy-2-oxoheptanedioate aldolase
MTPAGFTPMPRWLDVLACVKPALGITITLPDPSVAEVVAACGADWIMVDLEHSALATRDLEVLTLAAHSLGIPVLARVAENRLDDIQHVLDVGAAGVIVPRVRTRAEALRAVDYARYPPDGQRGFGPRRANRYGLDADYVQRANADLAVVVQIEHADAVAHLGEILTVPVSAVYVGPNDLAASLGLLGQPGHPDVVAAMDEVVGLAIGAGKPVGIASGDSVGARRYIQRGVDFLGVGGDVWLLAAAVTGVLESHRCTVTEQT